MIIAARLFRLANGLLGSSAIPGLAAKPILDIQIAVYSLAEMKFIAVPLVQKLGYEYWANNPE